MDPVIGVILAFIAAGLSAGVICSLSDAPYMPTLKVSLIVWAIIYIFVGLLVKSQHWKINKDLEKQEKNRKDKK